MYVSAFFFLCVFDLTMGRGHIEANVWLWWDSGFTYIELLEYNEYSKRQGLWCNILKDLIWEHSNFSWINLRRTPLFLCIIVIRVALSWFSHFKKCLIIANVKPNRIIIVNSSFHTVARICLWSGFFFSFCDHSSNENQEKRHAILFLV